MPMQVSGIMDKQKGQQDVPSNHDECIDAFEKLGYSVVWRQVQPLEAQVPCSRPRIHYIGLLQSAMLSGGDPDKPVPKLVKHCWEYMTHESTRRSPIRSLDAYLYGDFKCEKVFQLPSMEKYKDSVDESGIFLPIAHEPRISRKEQEPAWPQLHKEIMSRQDVAQLCSSEFDLWCWLKFMWVRVWVIVRVIALVGLCLSL